MNDAIAAASSAEVLQIAALSFRDVRTVKAVLRGGGSSLARASVAKALRELGLVHLAPGLSGARLATSFVRVGDDNSITPEPLAAAG